MNPAGILFISATLAVWTAGCIYGGFTLARQAAPNMQGLTCEWKLPAIDMPPAENE